ncbi:SprT family zinc-dependent metalloprotease [Asaia sp. BMEF1]|uniref:M48 family metallopeptidase n=1 Tax=unclassified Asaia TaxID=2685023 RepID=UPI00301984B0
MSTTDRPILWRRSARTRRLSLRIDPVLRQVIVTCPLSLSSKRAQDFVASHSAWIDEKLALLPARLRLVPEQQITLNDQAITLHHAPDQRRPALLEKGRLTIGGPLERFEARALVFMKHQSGVTLPAQLSLHAVTMGCTPTSIVCSNARTRWGSCARTGRIMLNWRLALMPKSVRDYVMIHELAHLTHFDHSRAFWHHVERFHPDRREAQNWLKDYGAGLLALG